MSVEYRKDRKKWGYRFYLRGQCFKRYAWETKTEAKEAEAKGELTRGTAQPYNPQPWQRPLAAI